VDITVSGVRGHSAVLETRGYLEKIAGSNPVLNAFITVTADSALEQAQHVDAVERDEANPASLRGKTIAIKDCIDVANVRCTSGSSFFADRIATKDAEIVRRLRDTGVIFVGKTNLHEFAFGGTSQNAFFGACRNPWDPTRVPGGSSGGSAVAVASGMAWGALGTDTGSSIRMPAALTGTTGLRPTTGSVPSDGILPVSKRLDVAGPIARSAADAACIHGALSGAGAGWFAGLDRTLSGVTIAVPDDFFFSEADEAIAQRVLDAARELEALGARIVTRSIPDAAEIQSILQPLLVADAAAFHRERLLTHPEGFSVGVRERMLPGLEMQAADYARGLRRIEEWSTRCAAFFANDADAMLTPTVPSIAPKIGDDASLTVTTSRLSRFCWAWPAAGAPALSVPCGFSEGMPVGFQIAAARNRDDLVLAIGHRYQQVTDWHLRRPPH
jgi:aspartyl-tRNA(Asn)/glutamyl-tRNA(Gln) amidotransferase subunit A